MIINRLILKNFGKKITSLVPDNGIVVIKVVDSKTGNILSGATVNINGKILRTNSEGEVQVNDVKPGEISATASDNGYTNGKISVKKILRTNSEGEVQVNDVKPGEISATASDNGYTNGKISVKVDPNGKVTGIISLTPDNGTVVIKVVNSKTGKVLSGATVNIDGQILHTNSNGEIQVNDVKPGEIIATASDKGYTNGQTSVKLDQNGKVTGIIALDPEAGKVIITVSGNNGLLRNKKIIVNGKEEKTNSNGQIIVGTTAGTNHIKISVSGYNDKNIDVNVTTGNTKYRTVTLTPKVASVRINTIGKDGNIISSKIVNENNPELAIPKGYKVSSITVNEKNLPDTGINNDIRSNIEGMVTWASILGILGIGEIFRRKNRK